MSLSNRNRVSKGYIVNEMHEFNILLESREIFIHGYIDNTDDDPGVEYRMSNNFIKNISLLTQLNSTDPIIIHQHSVGGLWSEGMMIYDAIQTCTAPVVMILHGSAISMGSIIPHAADLRVCMPNCWWMVHDGYTEISGCTMKQARSWNEWEQSLSKQMFEIYTSVCLEHGKFFKGKSEAQVRSYLKRQLDKKEDWWFTAEESVNLGFADAIWGAEGYESLDKIRSHVL